jgi:hypothetical protein
MHRSGCWAIGEPGSSFTREIVLVNPSYRDWTRHNYVLWFGAVGTTVLRVWANSLDDAIEEAAGWLADHAPGHVMAHWGEEHIALVREVCEEEGIAFPAPGEAPDAAFYESCERAEADLTYTESGYLTSYEWGILAEDPDRADLDALIGA